MNSLDQKLEKLPDSPGVYFFKDEKGTILYVGKAGNLKHRVGSYFQKPDGKDAKTLTLLERVSDIDTIITDTEKEAFILENNLIKEYRPRYNVKLRDDKTYPLLKLSMEDEFPTLCIVRRAKKDGSIYFGPYPSATSLRETLKLIRRLFPIRTCFDTKFTHRLRPCINYEMGRCTGPCCGKIDSAQYREVVEQVRMFLEGKDKDLVERLKEKMEGEAERLHFEGAAKIRDQIKHLEHVVERQKMVSSDFVDQDVIGFHRQDRTVIIHPLFIRAGKLLGGKGFTFPSTGLPDEEVSSSFLHQYYREGKFIPKRILISRAIPDQTLVEQWLTELKGEKVRILVPARGDKKRLLNLACGNAEKFLRAEEKIEKDQGRLLDALRESLHLRKIPWRIEAFDISNIQGENAVGSMVVFENGKAAKEHYRHFKIKTIEGADDYGMMFEVLLRRYRKALQKKDLPDLVLLDGGKGQLSVGQEVFKELRIKEVDLISLAKEKTIGGLHSSNFRRTAEKIFHPQFKEPLGLEKHSALLRFLDQIRDEAHRFAITYHKKLRGKETVKSELEDIPGIGKIRERELLKHFGGIKEIREATVEELSKAPKMNLNSAQMVYEFFRPPESPQ
jgi:excinuclease ABC subunit C